MERFDTEFTIDDIINSAKTSGIKCENCVYWLNHKNEQLNWSNCIYDYSIRCEKPKETHFSHFCSGFKPKTNDNN